MASGITGTVADFFVVFPLRTFDRQQLLIRPEQPLPGVFYLLEGLVDQYDVTPAGNEVVVNIFKPGAFFPMSAVLNGTPNEYFFEARTSVKVRVAPPPAVIRFLHDNPEVAFDLLKRVYRGTDGVLRRMSHLMGGDARHRLLFEIVNAAYRFGKMQSDGTLLITLSESNLGRQSGLARETVNRTLQTLKTTGLVDVAKNGIRITDLKQLEALLGNDV